MMNEEKRIQSYIHSPEKLIKEIDLELDKLELDELPLTILERKSDSESGDTSAPIHHPVLEALLNASKQKIFKKCCEDMNYCQMREKHIDTLSMIRAVGDTLISAAITFPLPAVTVASYCVLSLYMDRLCKCNLDL